MFIVVVSTHSHPKVAAPLNLHHIQQVARFQHTATRRWLRLQMKAEMLFMKSFNTQPPEGGCERKVRCANR